MDSPVLQIFGVDEVLERLGQKMLTGALHIFNQKEAANIFFRGGIVVAALKGMIEGEDVLRQVVDWKDARFAWVQDMAAPASLKPMQVTIFDFMIKVKTPSKGDLVRKMDALPIAPAPPPETPPPVAVQSRTSSRLPVSSARSANPVIAGFTTPTNNRPPAANSIPAPAAPIPIATQARASTPLPQPQPPRLAPPLPQQPQGPLATTILPGSRTIAPGAVVTNHTATRSVAATGTVRVAQEQILLSKHNLTLASLEVPENRIKITRVSSLFGRNPACDVTLDHASISRQHALMQITERGLHVKDLGTTNGTKVNGIAMTEGYVSPGDKLTLGHLNFMVEKA